MIGDEFEMEKIKRPSVKTIQEQWEEMVGKDCIVKPPSIKSWVVTGIFFMFSVIACFLILLFK
jgi:hypothetical protein